jgi:hypothetical protein
MNKFGYIISLIDSTLLEIEAEIRRHKTGNGTIGNVSQLDTCKQRLETILQELKKYPLPPKDKRKSGMGHMIADSWPIGSLLGQNLLKIEQAYSKL